MSSLCISERLGKYEVGGVEMVEFGMGLENKEFNGTLRGIEDED